MKKGWMLLLCLLFVLSLCACGGSEETGRVYTVEMDGRTFQVDPIAQTVFDGTNTYSYTFQGDSASYRINITYPDGSGYFWQQNGNAGGGGGSEDYREGAYEDGWLLCRVITARRERASSSPSSLWGILLLILGVVNAVYPRIAWFLRWGWWYRNAEPSELALGIIRAAGIIAAFVGIILLIV